LFDFRGDILLIIAHTQNSTISQTVVSLKWTRLSDHWRLSGGYLPGYAPFLEVTYQIYILKYICQASTLTFLAGGKPDH
jgi:hypothetical protein